MAALWRTRDSRARRTRTRTDIDTSRIALFGVSQGGAVVMLAGPAGEGGTLFLDEMRAKLLASGMGAAAVATVLAATRPFMIAQAAGASPADTAPLA